MSRFGPGDQLDSYEIDELLGVGAYNESYRATDVRNGRKVVLKIPDPQLFADPATYSRYRREAEVSRRLNHPSVQSAVDAGESRDEPYLVLQYIEGTSLRARLPTRKTPPPLSSGNGRARPWASGGCQDLPAPSGGRGNLPVVTVVDWGKQLATGLAYLAREGIVHRDLKPENVLVTAEDQLVISDFGTAQLAGARRLTWKHLTGTLGTTYYMSPEQAQGERGDARSDIYAWGVMMYEMLTGRVPFSGDDWMAVMAAHLQSDPAPIGRSRNDVPAALEAVVMHAMRRYPDSRYQSAEDLLVDLGRLDRLDPGTYDRTPERPMGGMVAAAGSAKRLWSKMRRH